MLSALKIAGLSALLSLAAHWLVCVFHQHTIKLREQKEPLFYAVYMVNFLVITWLYCAIAVQVWVESFRLVSENIFSEPLNGIEIGFLFWVFFGCAMATIGAMHRNFSECYTGFLTGLIAPYYTWIALRDCKHFIYKIRSLF